MEKEEDNLANKRIPAKAWMCEYLTLREQRALPRGSGPYGYGVFQLSFKRWLELVKDDPVVRLRVIKTWVLRSDD